MSAFLFLVTYDGDADWLPWCNQSVARFCSGFDTKLAVFPRTSGKVRDYFAKNKLRGGFTPHEIPEYLPGHQHQQMLKLYADLFFHNHPAMSQAAAWDTIHFVDTDHFICHHVTPAAWLDPQGRPYIVTATWEEADALSGCHVPWRPGTERFLGLPCPRETMRSPYICHYAETLARTRRQVEVTHRLSSGMGVFDFGMKQWDTSRDFYPADRYVGQTRGTPGFSEFNAMGTVALALHPERYAEARVNTPSMVGHLNFIRQSWSHRPPTQEECQNFEDVLKK